MKNKVVKILKDISSGNVKTAGVIVGVILLLLLAAILIFIIPSLLLWGLYLMGLPVNISFKSFLGACLVTMFFWILRSKSEKSSGSN
jgi:hypothetical protein